MTNFVVGNGIHLPSLVVSTVGVVSPTVLDATDSVVAAEETLQSFQLFPPRQWSKLLQKHQIKSRFAYFKRKVYQRRILKSITFSKLALSILQRYLFR